MATHAAWLLVVGILISSVVLWRQVQALDTLTLVWNFPALLSLLLFAGLAYGLSVLIWRRLVQSTCGQAPYWKDGLRGLGWLLVGKYLPGKVVGLVGRGAILPESVTTSARIWLVLVEQALGVWGLVSAMVIFASFSSINIPVEVLGLATALCLAVPWIGVRVFAAVATLPRFAGAGLVRLPSSVITWMASLLLGLVVLSPAMLVDEFVGLDLHRLDKLGLAAAYGASVVAGMVVFVLPAGIGVREAVFVAASSSIVAPHEALVVALVLRLWSVTFDLTGGAMAALLSMNRNSSSG